MSKFMGGNVFNRALFFVVLVMLVLGLAIPFHQTWGAPAFQTVPTAGPSPTRRPTTAAPTQPSLSPSQTSAPDNTSVPTRTRRATSLPPVNTDVAVLSDASATSEPTQPPSETALPASETPLPTTPSTSPTLSEQALPADSIPTETQPSQDLGQSEPVTPSVELPEPAQAGTNWLPALAILLALVAVGIWVAQRRRS